MSRNELRQKTNRLSLAKVKKYLSYVVQRRRMGASLIPEISQTRRVVRVNRHSLTSEVRQKTPDREENSQELALIDGKA